MAESNGWVNLGAAFGGDSEKSYQEGLALGAKTEDALAQARERVEKNAARARMETDLRATGVDANTAKAASTALTAGASLTDPIQLMLKNQEFGFRAKAGDPNVPLDIGQRALLGVASGPVDPIYKVGNRAYNKFQTPDNVEDLGAVFGGDGGQSSFVQNATALGVLKDGQVADANRDGVVNDIDRAIAYEVLRNTDYTLDKGGVQERGSGNLFGDPRGTIPRPGAPGATAAPPGATVNEVASNAAQIAASKEAGQMAGRNAAGLESTLATIDKFDQDIDNFLSKPGFKGLYGNIQGTDVGKMVMGLLDEDVADARGAFDSLGGEAFLASIQKMRGFGQLSNQEGAKVQTALTRALDSRISEADAKRAWQEVKLHLAELKRVAALESQVATPGTAPAAPAAGTGHQPVGTTKVLGGKKYVKTAQGWMEDDGT
jgi:hypothetical protein